MASSGSPASQSRILIGLVAGAIVGVTINYVSSKGMISKSAVEAVVNYVTKPAGEMFINLLFLAIIPLVFASLSLGVTKLGGTADLGRIGFKTVSYFIITTACAAVIGLICVNLIKPGHHLPEKKRIELMEYYANDATKSLEKRPPVGMSTIVNVVPRNPLESMVKKDMLAVIFTAFLVGVALTRIETGYAKILTDLLEGVNQIAEFILKLAMAVAPIGVFALIFSTTALFGYELLVALGAFVGTVLLGLFIQLVIVFPPLVKFLGGMSPVLFFQKIRGTMATAFSTSSSSATLPTAMKCAEEDLGISTPVTRFVLPLSASMNHNGTALFEGVTVMFLAQAFGVELTIQNQLLVLLLCVLTATGMAGVPGGSLPLIGMVLAAVGVQEGAIAIVLGVDRILDMFRTMVNVTGDMTTVVFVARGEAQGNGDKSGSTNDDTASADANRSFE
ncbi:MAG: dicarboxylate/amino acid:cation symporter [Gemmataceae bacterium]